MMNGLLVFIPLSKSGQCHVYWLFSSPFVWSFHPVIKVRAMPQKSNCEYAHVLRFHPVIKVRAMPLYLYKLLLCKRYLGSLRRGGGFLSNHSKITPKTVFFPYKSIIGAIYPEIFSSYWFNCICWNIDLLALMRRKSLQKPCRVDLPPGSPPSIC